VCPINPITNHFSQADSPFKTKAKAPVTYQVSEQPSSKVQEEEFAKQLRLARYLAAGRLAAIAAARGDSGSKNA
jgi:hypothetical protein